MRVIALHIGVGANNRFALAIQLFDQFAYLRYTRRIKPVRRFIKHEYFGIAKQSGRNGKTLFHPKRIRSKL